MANLSREAREDRELKEEAELFERTDDTYLEIEAFKEYEFSWCIAFEMAKRDPELKSKVTRFIKFYKSHEALIDFIPKDRDFFNEADGYRKHRRVQEIFIYGYDYLHQVFWLKPIDLFYITGDETALKMAETYVHLAYDIQDQQENERFIIEDTEGALFESSTDMQNEHFFQDKEEVSDKEILEAIEAFDIDPTQFKAEVKVSENFTRPKLSIPDTVRKSVQLELNLALPEKELLAYVSLLKKKYDGQKDIIKSTYELLGAQLSDMGFEEIDAEQMYKHNRKKTLAEKCADLFFVYDCKSNNLSMDYTTDELSLYWYGEAQGTSRFQERTYKQYWNLAKDFIENRKYQSLLMGQ